MGQLNIPGDVNQVSDGYHTFGELYDHRCLLFLALMKRSQGGWYSEKQSDGFGFEGWFIAGMWVLNEQITYHIPNKFLSLVQHSDRIEHLDTAPEYDGHSSADVLSRLEAWIESGCLDCSP